MPMLLVLIVLGGVALAVQAPLNAALSRTLSSPVAAAAGGVVGGIAGGSVGGRRESVAVGVLGAVAGAVIGNAIERGATQENAVEIMVQLRNGERRAIVQAKGNEELKPGEAVIIVTTGGKVRVTRAPAGTPAAPAGTETAVPRG